MVYHVTMMLCVCHVPLYSHDVMGRNAAHLEVHEAEGLEKVVSFASRLAERSQRALEVLKSRTGANKAPDVAIRTLERDIRGLQLALPGARDLSMVHLATANIERVLGAVERYASELPEDIERAEAMVPRGSTRSSWRRRSTASRSMRRPWRSWRAPWRTRNPPERRCGMKLCERAFFPRAGAAPGAHRGEIGGCTYGAHRSGRLGELKRAWKELLLHAFAAV